MTDEPAIVEAGVATVEPPKREPSLKTITNIENVVNEYARTVCKKGKYGIKDDEFVILLSRRFKGIMGLQRGRPVKITFAWPDAQPHLNTLLHNAFSQIRQHKMVDIWAIERVIHIKSRNVESRNWRREKFGDLGEIIGELIPKKNIKVEITTKSIITTTIRDLGSDVFIEKTETVEKTEGHDGRVLDVKSWLEISRMARDAEEGDEDDGGTDNEVAPTPPAE